MFSLNGLGPKSICVFDFDGTLVDSMGGFADLAASLIEESYDVTFAKARDAYIRTSGLPFSEQLEVLFPKDSKNLVVTRAFESKKKQTYFEQSFFQDVPEGIRALRAAGLRVVVSSNNGQELVEEFLSFKAEVDFDLVLGFKPGFAKGEDHFNKVLNHFERVHTDIVFVGDSLHDARKAVEFGLDFVGRVGTFSKEKFRQINPHILTIEGLDELRGILCKSSC